MQPLKSTWMGVGAERRAAVVMGEISLEVI